MALPSLFKIPRHRQFSYSPLYYNPQREKLQERIKNIEAEMGVKREDAEKYVPRIEKGQMRGYFHKIKRQKKQSNIRLLIILFVLFFLAYLLFYQGI
jgi:hypothetical protein